MLVLCLSCFLGCNDSKNKKEPEVTEFEESMIGEWLLYDVFYVQHNGLYDSIVYTYPSSSDVFNNFYNTHVNKTKIVFERKAFYDFPLSLLHKAGALYDGENSIKFGWFQLYEDGTTISFEEAIKLDAFDGEKVCKKSANRAFTVTKNGNTTLLIAPGTYTTYRFQKIK